MTMLRTNQTKRTNPNVRSLLALESVIKVQGTRDQLLFRYPTDANCLFKIPNHKNSSSQNYRITPFCCQQQLNQLLRSFVWKIKCLIFFRNL